MSEWWTGPAELPGTWVALLLTLFIFSSLWRDNALSRLAEHLLIGTAAGYAGVVAVRQVLIPRLVTPLLIDPVGNGHLLVPAALAVLWLAPFFGRERAAAGRLRPLSRWAGSLGLALLFGVGAGLIVGGAWLGTLWPQALAATRVGQGLRNLWLLVITTGVLRFFYDRFSGRSAREATPRAGKFRTTAGWFLQIWSWIGQAALFIAFGVIFARAGTARLALLIDRLQFMILAAEETGLLGVAQAIWNGLAGS